MCRSRTLCVTIAGGRLARAETVTHGVRDLRADLDPDVLYAAITGEPIALGKGQTKQE